MTILRACSSDVNGLGLRRVLAAVVALKLGQEWALHGARLFDEINGIEFLEGVARVLIGP